MEKLVSTCLPASLSLSCSWCCVISLQLRQVLLYYCCILLLLNVCVNVCGEQRDGVRENMFCVCVCVLASLAVLCCHGNAGHMAQAALLCQSRAAGSPFVSVEKKCTHTEEACESDRWTDSLKDSLGLRQPHWVLVVLSSEHAALYMSYAPITADSLDLTAWHLKKDLRVLSWVNL